MVCLLTSLSYPNQQDLKLFEIKFWDRFSICSTTNLVTLPEVRRASTASALAETYFKGMCSQLVLYLSGMGKQTTPRFFGPACYPALDFICVFLKITPRPKASLFNPCRVIADGIPAVKNLGSCRNQLAIKLRIMPQQLCVFHDMFH